MYISNPSIRIHVDVRLSITDKWLGIITKLKLHVHTCTCVYTYMYMCIQCTCVHVQYTCTCTCNSIKCHHTVTVITLVLLSV